MTVETVARTRPERRLPKPRIRRAERPGVRGARVQAVLPAAPVPGTAAVSPDRIGAVVTEAPSAAESAEPTTRSRLRGALSRLNTPAFRTHLGTVVGVVILAVLFWRLGTGVFLDGLRRIDGAALAGGLGIGLVTTVFSAWRWQLVARGLRIRLPLWPAVADYYRALFLNAALPGGVLGDVHRAVRHGQSAGDMGRGVRAVVLERTAGQVVLAAFGAVVLLTMPSPVLNQARDITPLILFAGVGALAVVAAVRMNRAPSRRDRSRPSALRTTLDEAREALLSRRNGPGVAVSSAVVLAGHIGMFVLAARVAGSDASVAALVPLAVLALLAMGLPLNVGGWGPGRASPPGRSAPPDWARPPDSRSPSCTASSASWPRCPASSSWSSAGTPGCARNPDPPRPWRTRNPAAIFRRHPCPLRNRPRRSAVTHTRRRNPRGSPTAPSPFPRNPAKGGR